MLVQTVFLLLPVYRHKVSVAPSFHNRTNLLTNLRLLSKEYLVDPENRPSRSEPIKTGLPEKVQGVIVSKV